MIKVRKSQERGSADHGWLQSRHTFSFGSYYDPKHMGVSALRVINDDRVQPGAGFATHSHQDMEIISYVKQGVIEHKDSMDNTERLPAGEFQLMSAGTGVTHSEYNASKKDELTFLQIWIEPNQLGVEPGYQQKKFAEKSGLQMIISPDGGNGTLKVHQDAYLYQLLLDKDGQATFDLPAGRTAYLHIVRGQISVDDKTLKAGDGATIKMVNDIGFKGVGADNEALFFDLP